MLVFCLGLVQALGQTPTNVVKTDISQAEIDQIIKKFTENEAKFRQALTVYAYNRHAAVASIGMGGQITGTFRRDSFLTFKDSGERFEKILLAPISTLKDFTITEADLENLGGLDPFAIEPKVADQYKFTFLGKEKVDELELFVFDVAPKVMPNWKKGIARFFQGRIWVEQDGFAIVRSKGKAVPEGKERFPIIETTREPVDNKYYFPVDSRADDELVFDNGDVAKIKIRVQYKNYRVGRTDVKILEDEPETTPSPTPVKKPL